MAFLRHIGHRETGDGPRNRGLFKEHVPATVLGYGSALLQSLRGFDTAGLRRCFGMEQEGRCELKHSGLCDYAEPQCCGDLELRCCIDVWLRCCGGVE